MHCLKRVGKNEYLAEYIYFNPWISYTGEITWVPEVRVHSKCEINVKFARILFMIYYSNVSI